MRRPIVTFIVVMGAVAATVAWTFRPALGFAFLNWDDQAVVLQNPSLEFPGVVRWAFSTTYMEHYQPLSWLVWAAVKRQWGLEAASFHAANLVAHGLAMLMVWVVARRVMALWAPEMTSAGRDAAAVASALLFGLHPLRVEVVAWVSALPYALALVLLLASLAAHVRAVSGDSARWAVAAIALYAGSLLARPIGLGFPVVVFLIDTTLLRRPTRSSAVRALALVVPALVVAGVETVARSSGLNETPWIYRLQLAATAPFIYLWHTVAPVGLTPLDALPLHPIVNPWRLGLALLGLLGVTVAAWGWRRRSPAAWVAWVAYLALLVPAVGLMSSGLQATADRYTYLPAVVVAIVAAGAGASWTASRPRRVVLAVAAGAALTAAFAVMAQRTLAPWSDSVSLWTRVVSLDPASDVGLYNLGTTLTAAGQPDEAAARYRELLALQPAHADARANLARLDAERLEREGNDLAIRGNLAAAADRYGEAIALDPKRTHSHAGRGMALATLGRAAEAMSSLREATRQGADDPAVSSALGILLIQSGQTHEARTVLEAGLASHQNDVSLAGNLARLLAISPERATDAETALRLASAVADATGNRDPVVLETYATALAANGRLAEARAANAKAAALAAQQGDKDLAVQITARGRAYRNPGQ